jgi:PAS domain S-box-containing protein
LLSENVTDGVSLFEDNKVKYVSEGYLKMFGFDKQEIENISLENIVSFIHNDDKIRIKEAIENAHKNQIKEFRYNYRVKAKNGEYFWVEDIINAEYDSFGNHIRSIIHSRDVTEIKQFEKKLLQLNSDKDKFFSIIAHDLKSPFNTFLGYTQMMAEELDSMSNKDIQKISALMNKSAINLYNLLENLLNWSRIQQGLIPFKPQKIVFADAYQDAIEVLRPNAEAKNISIHHFTTKDLTVFADIDMLKMVIRNLVSNAIKFSNNGGAININAKQTLSDVIISVSDNGVGIEPNNIATLFDVGKVHTTTGTASEKGTGLGLFLCKEFVEKHGGKIWVESEVGKGSYFKFNLPLSYGKSV